MNAGPGAIRSTRRRVRRLVALVLCSLGLASASAGAAGAEIIWRADMETGNLSQWERGRTALAGQSVDSGDCRRPRSGVSREVARSGRFSMAMTIDTSRTESACRQYRYEETQSGWPLFYSAWFYLPRFHEVDDFWNLIQFKSKRFDDVRGVFWVLDLEDREQGRNLYLKLRWKGEAFGPYAESRGKARKVYTQRRRLNVPVGRWFHVEVYLRQSERFDGRIIVWQDGTRIYDVANVRTRWPRGDQRMSMNAYSNGLAPPVATLYVDDAAISTTRVHGRRAGSTPAWRGFHPPEAPGWTPAALLGLTALAVLAATRRRPPATRP